MDALTWWPYLEEVRHVGTHGDRHGGGIEQRLERTCAISSNHFRAVA